MTDEELREMVRLREELDKARATITKKHAIIKGVHGALMDSRTVPVPGMDDYLYDSVMQIVRERDEAYERAAQVCDDKALYTGFDCAVAIRELIGEK